MAEGKPGMSVLVVDDEAGVRDLVEKILRSTGWFETFVHAKDGAEAWAKVANQKFDLIVVDLNMPKISGLELMAMIKKNMEYKKIPIVVISAQLGQDQLFDAVRLGVRNLVVKPFKREMLIKTVARLFKSEDLDEIVVESEAP